MLAMMRFWILCTVMGGCAISSERAEERWDESVDANNSCETADDCVVVYPGCPLGCFTAVSADAEQQATAEAQSIVDAYERGGRSCEYDCLGSLPPTCDAGVCNAAPDDKF